MLKCIYWHYKYVEAREVHVSCCPFHWNWARRQISAWGLESGMRCLRVRAWRQRHLPPFNFCFDFPQLFWKWQEQSRWPCIRWRIVHVVRSAFPLSRRPSVCALRRTAPALGAVLRSASIQSKASKINYSDLSRRWQRAVVGKHLPKQHLRGDSRGARRLPEPPGRRSVPFSAAAEGGNVVSRSPGRADLTETAAAPICPQLSLASKLHVREIRAWQPGGFVQVCAPSLLHNLQ